MRYEILRDALIKPANAAYAVRFGDTAEVREQYRTGAIKPFDWGEVPMKNIDAFREAYITPYLRVLILAIDYGIGGEEAMFYAQLAHEGAD